MSLGLGELSAAIVFFAVALFLVTPLLNAKRNSVALWSAPIPLLSVLVSAGSELLFAIQS